MQVSDPLYQFLNNKVACTTFMGWFCAQMIKVIIGVITEKRFNFKWFVGTGGMPSSHSAGVTALTASVGLQEGTGTALFVVSLLFTIIVISDAQGVRRSTGRAAEILNKIMDDIYWKGKIQEDRLKELVGHTPIQVFAGIGIGLIVAISSYKFF
ncbi:MAG: divergent PAP2 family protein [Candidatus Omnitrophica bacterium]|nr:divergent PAP2 family protein [Candidatus Omnitrophota bacterium]MDD4013925.1 divergent PAP2 family protein [Candidatus Omnitrophota bacterium]